MNAKLQIRFIQFAVIPFFSCSLQTIASVEVIEKTDDHAVVQNESWTLWFNRNQGWGITRIESGKAEAGFRNGWFFDTHYRPKTTRVEDGGMWPEGAARTRPDDPVSFEMEVQDSGSLKTRRVWTAGVGTITETTTFHAKDSRFDRRVVLNAEKPVSEYYIEARCLDQDKASRVIFQPEGERVSGSSACMTGEVPFMEAYDRDTGLGLGIQAVSGVPRTGRFAFGDPERGDDKHPLHRKRDYFGVALYSPLLSYQAPPYEHVIEFPGYISVNNERPISYDAPPIELVKAWPVKMVTRPEEGNTLRVVLQNHTSKDQEVRLDMELRHGVDDRVVMDPATIILPPGRTETRYEIDTRDLRFGVQTRTTVTESGSGDTQSLEEFFTVWNGYYRVSPLMSIHNVGGARGVLSSGVTREREGYVGVREIYNWPRNSIFDMTPETDWYLGGPYYFLSWSRDYIKEYIAQCHENGMGVVSWAQAMIDISDAMEYPHYLQYTKQGQFHSDLHRVFEDGAAQTQGVLPPGPVENMAVSVNFGYPGLSRRWGEEMAASCRMFDWDGVRFDGPAPRFVPGQIADPLKWKPGQSGAFYDFDGKPLLNSPGPETDNASLRNMSAWLEEARKGNPKFELGMNIGHGISGGPEPFPDEFEADAMSIREWPRSLEYAGRQQPMWLHEGALSVTSAGQNTWQTWSAKLMGLYRMTQRLGGVCTVGHIRGLPPAPDRARSYVAFASGHRLAYVESEEHSTFGNEKYHAAEFATRFGEFLFAPDYELLPVDQNLVRVAGHDRLLWKDFVRRRDTEEGGTEWVVHLVNLPESDVIARNDPYPPARTDTRISVSVERPGNVNGAWILLPEPPRVMETEFVIASDRVFVSVPEIDAFATMVLRLN